MKNTFDLTLFTNSYLHTASWVTCEGDENTEFTKDAQKWAYEHCKTFVDKCIKEMGETNAMSALTMKGQDITYIAAHDLFLSESGQGAGFWDYCKDYGGKEISDQLQKIAESMGNVDCGHVRGKKSKLSFN